MTTLTPSMRKDADKLITQRAANVTAALQQEISIDLDVIRDKLLKLRGIPKSSDELREERRMLERQIDDVETSDLPGLEELRTEYDQVDELLDREIEALKVQQRVDLEAFRQAQNNALDAARKDQECRLVEIRSKQEAIKTAAVEAEYPGAVERVKQIKEELPAVSKIERQIEDEAQRKADAIEHNRARLLHLVNDAAARAKQQLLNAEDSREINAILSVIPSVAEIINISEDPEGGLAGIVERLAPDRPLAIAAPKFEIINQDDGSLPIKAVVDGMGEVEIVYVED